MDPATIAGIVIAIGALVVMAQMEGAHIQSLLLAAPMILVFGGTIGAAMASTTLKDTIGSLKMIPKAFLYKAPKMGKDVESLVELAETARKEGLLALEAKASDIKDPFLKKALQNVADGMDADELRILMEDEAASLEKEGRRNAQWNLQASTPSAQPTEGSRDGSTTFRCWRDCSVASGSCSPSWRSSSRSPPARCDTPRLRPARWPSWSS